MKVGADTVVASSHVRLLDVDISLDMSVDRHVSRVCAGCFYRLPQLRRIRRSLDSDSLATLIYAVVNSRMDRPDWCTKDSNGIQTNYSGC